MLYGMKSVFGFRFVLIILSTIVFVFIAVNPSVGAETGYVSLLPENVTVEDFSVEERVIINISASEYQAGQIKLSYEGDCINLTNFQRNNEFGLGGWNPSEGESLITFVSMSPLSGKHSIGTAFVECIKTNCSTQILIGEGSDIFYPNGSKISMKWTGNFVECVGEDESLSTTPIDIFTPPTPPDTISDASSPDSEAIVNDSKLVTGNESNIGKGNQSKAINDTLSESDTETNVLIKGDIKEGPNNETVLENLTRTESTDAGNGVEPPIETPTKNLIPLDTSQPEEETVESKPKPMSAPIGTFSQIFALIISLALFERLNGFRRK